AASHDSSTARTGGSAATVRSVTTSARWTPRSARSIPHSRVTPAPNRTFDTAISKADSLLSSRPMAANSTLLLPFYLRPFRHVLHARDTTNDGADLGALRLRPHVALHGHDAVVDVEVDVAIAQDLIVVHGVLKLGADVAIVGAGPAIVDALHGDLVEDASAR